VASVLRTEELNATQGEQDSASRTCLPGLAEPNLAKGTLLMQLHCPANRPPVARSSLLPLDRSPLGRHLRPVVERVPTARTQLLDLNPVFLDFIAVSPLDERSGDAPAVLVQALAWIGPPGDTDVVADRVTRVEVDGLETAWLAEAQKVNLSRRARRRARPDALPLARDHPRRHESLPTRALRLTSDTTPDRPFCVNALGLGGRCPTSSV
jgi:hypothetical protein